MNAYGGEGPGSHPCHVYEMDRSDEEEEVTQERNERDSEEATYFNTRERKRKDVLKERKGVEGNGDTPSAG